MIGLKFCLIDMHWFAIVTTQEEAKRVVEQWAQGKLPPMIGSTNIYGQGGAIWTLRTDALICVHTFELEDKDKPKNAVGNFPGLIGRSGI